MDNEIKKMESLIEDVNSETLVMQAFSDFIRIEKKDKVTRIIVVLLSFALAFAVAISENTVGIVKAFVEDSMNVSLAILGIVFTGYALLQAFINDDLVVRLFDAEDNGKSQLKIINDKFVYLMILLAFSLIPVMFLKILLGLIKNDYLLFSDMRLNILCACSGIGIMFSFAGIVLLRVVSFITTMYKLFNLYAASKIIRNKQDK